VEESANFFLVEGRGDKTKGGDVGLGSESLKEGNEGYPLNSILGGGKEGGIEVWQKKGERGRG